MKIDKLVVKGYKSIKECELQLKNLNVLIGCNGAGKSNFISLFRMLQNIFENKLQNYISYQGGPDSLLHFGRKVTDEIIVRFTFGNNGYGFCLRPTSDNRMMFEGEWFYWDLSGARSLGSGHFETMSNAGTQTRIDQFVKPVIKDWRVYHFHDTSETAYVKQQNEINDNLYLRPDARNLAAFLYMLKTSQKDAYMRIVKTINLVAPFFGDFLLRQNPLNPDKIELEWIGVDNDIPFKAAHFSDGTLRFICLATVLLQPSNLQPETILIDEPELGLHPYAITVLASLIKKAAKEKQLIISTQSVELLNEFEAEDVVVVDRNNNESVFKRLNEEELQVWLEDDYSLGDLWKKNLLGGRPSK